MRERKLNTMDAVRQLPKVDLLATDPLLAGFDRSVQIQAARQAIDEARQIMLASPDVKVDLVSRAVELASLLSQPGPKPTINMSGVILHTGLGRARLAEYASDAIRKAAGDHSAVEFDLSLGSRGDRQALVRDLVCKLTGAEDALVVNNCAAAVYLVLAATSAGREVILSRGEMVEIGGSFRMPDIVRQSGCRLIEVGCTNKTRLSDYSSAITEATSCLLRCHHSNFKIIGFTESPSGSDLSKLAHESSLLFVEDLGSGCLVDTTAFGIPPQRTVQQAVRDGADLVLFSGDKLLGGPQSGIIVGSSQSVSVIAQHPLARALRVDKLTLAGLRATLQLYDWNRSQEIPTIRYMARTVNEVRDLANVLAAHLSNVVIEEGVTEVGGGAAPGEGVATVRVGITKNARQLASLLLRGNPAVVARIEDDVLWLDPRTAEEEEVRQVNGILRALQ